MSTIILMTDFGTADPYSGILKGVIAKITPHVRCIDLTHEIPPGDILRAAIFLWQSRAYFPENSVFLSIIDPGVGTSRRALILKSREQLFVGPDNGIFSFIFPQTKIWLIHPSTITPTPSYTFHGRDIFAPLAAYLALGHQPGEYGTPINEIHRITYPKLECISPRSIIEEILYEDRFGNLITSLGTFSWKDMNILQITPWLPTEKTAQKVFDIRYARIVLPNSMDLPIVHTYGELEQGKCGCLIGSSGLMEIAANQSRASQILNLQKGDTISLEYRGER